MCFGGLTQSKTSTNVEPYGPTKPLLGDIYKDALDAYRQGPYYYQGSTVTPFANQSTSAFDGMMNLSGRNSGGRGMSDNLQQIMNNGGFTRGQMGTLGDMRHLAGNNGLQNLASDGFTAGQQNTLSDLRQNTNQNNNILDRLIGNGGLTNMQGNALQDLNRTTNRATNMLGNLMDNGGYNASQQSALQDARGLMNNNPFNDLLQGNGLTDMQQGAYNQLNRSSNRANNTLQGLVDSGGLNDIQQGAIDRYTQTATTPFDINNNPAYKQVRDNALAAQGQSLNGQAAAAGRYAGGANQSILAREQGKLAGQMDYNEYQNDQNQKNMANAALMQGGQAGVANTSNALSQIQGNNTNRFNAAGTGLQNQLSGTNALQGLQNNVFNMGQQGVNNRMGAANQSAQMQSNLLNAGQIGVNNRSNAMNQQMQQSDNLLGQQQQGVNNRFNAINQLSGLQGTLFNAQNSGLGNMGSAYQTALQPYQTQRSVGQQYEDLYTRNMQDQMRRFDAQNPLNQFSQYLQIANGTGAGNTQTQMPSTLQTILGGGLGTLGLLGGLGMF